MCSKKKKITVIQPEDFNKLETGSVLQKVVLKIQKNFQESIRSNIFFLILLTKTLHQGYFLCNFLK